MGNFHRYYGFHHGLIMHNLAQAPLRSREHSWEANCKTYVEAMLGKAW